MKRFLLLSTILAALPFTAQAHKAWLLPHRPSLPANHRGSPLTQQYQTICSISTTRRYPWTPWIITAPNGSHERPREPNQQQVP